jgi:hypothetical protein
MKAAEQSKSKVSKGLNCGSFKLAKTIETCLAVDC